MPSNRAPRLKELKQITAELKRHDKLLKDAQGANRKLEKGSAEYLKNMIRIDKITENINNLGKKKLILDAKESDIVKNIHLEMQKIHGVGSHNLTLSKNLTKMGEMQFQMEHKANLAKGATQKFWQMTADLSKEVIDNSIKGLSMDEAHNKLLQVENAIQARMVGNNKDQRVEMLKELDIIRDRISEQQNEMKIKEKAEKQTAKFMGQLNKVTDIIEKVPGGGIILKKLGLDEEGKKMIAEKMTGAFTTFIGGGMKDVKGLGKNIAGIFGKQGVILLGLAAGVLAFGALVKIAKDFSKNIDQIGVSLGAMGVQNFSKSLMSADAEMMKLGYDAGEAEKIASQLTGQFTHNYEAAIKIAPAIADMSKALGMSTEEGTNLVRTYSKLGKLSYEQSITLSKQTALMAEQQGVAPHKVMKDIAQNGELFASYMKDGGANIGKAAIMARKLGTNLSTVGQISGGLLDFESSITKEMEASIMIGKQLNFQKARELALSGDIEGVMSEVIKQVGSEAEFNAMNVLQRKALADSIGVSVEQMAKFVGRQERAATLSGQISEQKGFGELIGKDAISSMSEIFFQLKSIGAELTLTLGPILEIVIGAFGKFVKSMTESKGMMLALKTVAVILGGALLKMAIGGIWSASFATLGLIPGIGPALATVAAGVAIAKLMSSVAGAVFPAGDEATVGGKQYVSRQKGGLFKTESEDKTITSPKAQEILAQSEAFSLMTVRLNEVVTAVEDVTISVKESGVALIKVVSALPLPIGSEVGKELKRVGGTF
jgi:hypothetical protein